MNYLKRQKQNHVYEMKNLEVTRDQRSYHSAIQGLLIKEKKQQAQQDEADKNKRTVDEELQTIREEDATERWIAHAAWEVRKWGYVVSNEEEWTERFVHTGYVRPEHPKPTFEMVTDL